MSANVESVRARRYLLGQASEEESAVLEQEYLKDDDAVDRIAAAEDDLIEDYLAGDLSSADRDLFERSYLPPPRHRVRVDTVRRLMAQASRSGGSAAGSAAPRKVVPISSRVLRARGPWLALAATLVVVASIVAWLTSPLGRTATDVAENRTQSPGTATPGPSAGAPAAAPRVLALTVSPVAVRSASDAASMVVPSDTDVLAIRFETDADSRRLTASRAAIRTVGGGEVWQGAVTPDSNPPRGSVARIDVPAKALPADDYLITLYGTDARGAEIEWAQYFLRVRAG